MGEGDALKMKILIAEDDAVSRHILEKFLKKWGYRVTVTENGNDAWDALMAANAPTLAVLDWMMPGLDGVDIVRKFRQERKDVPTYFILLTALSKKDYVVQGLAAGADDYVTKPFDQAELRARVEVGKRVVNLQLTLSDKVRELEAAAAHIKTLQGVIPICMHCHKIRTDETAWEKLESYIESHSHAQFSHGLCPQCLDKYYPEN